MFNYCVISLTGEVLGQSNTWTGADRMAAVFRAAGIVCRVSTHVEFAVARNVAAA